MKVKIDIYNMCFIIEQRRPDNYVWTCVLSGDRGFYRTFQDAVESIIEFVANEISHRIKDLEMQRLKDLNQIRVLEQDLENIRNMRSTPEDRNKYRQMILRMEKEIGY